MRYPARGWRRARATVCISSQVGCAVGCPFCATGELGFGRDLDVAEIVDQVRFWRLWLAGVGQRLTNVVFMGMGEPLLNVESRPRRGGGADRRAALRARHAARDDQHQRCPARPRAAHRRATAVHPGRLAACRAGGAARRARAAQQALPHPIGRRGGRSLRVADAPPGDLRVRDDRLDQRHAADCRCGRAAASRPWRAREPDPDEPRRAHALAAELDRAHRAVRCGASRGAYPTTVRRNRGVDIGAACGQLAADRAGAPAPAAVARRRELLVLQSAAALDGARPARDGSWPRSRSRRAS